MSVTQSSRGSTSGYQVVHRSREFRTLRRRFARFVVPVTVLFIGWCFRYVLVAVFAPGFVRTGVAGDDPATGASLSLVADTHINCAFFPLDNPGIVSIPVAFFLGWLGSVTGRQPSDPVRFARIQVRALAGVGAERVARTEAG
jgi:uncharacterized membrane protein (DUF485 family)